jgi:uncharacterized membrane protein YjgN (DUF898 family)
LLTVLILGLALPWREAALERYKLRHLHYGDLQGRFDGTGWGLFKRGWWLWLLLIAFVTVLIAAARLLPGHKGLIGLLFLLLLVAGPFGYSAYKAIAWRWWVGGIRIGEVGFESDLRTTALARFYWATIGWMALIMLIDAILIGIAFTLLPRLLGAHAGAQSIALLTRQHQYLFFCIILANYLVIALCASVITRLYLIRGVWERVVASATVHNLDQADNVSARGDLVSALGEGFADGLDVVGF